MTKTIKICDVCKKEVDWLYEIPRINIQGLTVVIEQGHETELCEDCMRDWLKYIKRDYFKERGVK